MNDSIHPVCVDQWPFRHSHPIAPSPVPRLIHPAIDERYQLLDVVDRREQRLLIEWWQGRLDVPLDLLKGRGRLCVEIPNRRGALVEEIA